jgi:hypothetical protein
MTIADNNNPTKAVIRKNLMLILASLFRSLNCLTYEFTKRVLETYTIEEINTSEAPGYARVHACHAIEAAKPSFILHGKGPLRGLLSDSTRGRVRTQGLQ